MSVIESTNKPGAGLGGSRPKVAAAVYDFAALGGAQGSITLQGGTVPSGAVVTDSLIVVDTKLESGGEATVIVGVEGENDLQASKKVSEAPWSTTGAKRGAVTATGTAVVTTAARSIKAKIGTADLTKGKFRVFVTYLDVA
jgi:hypothetical protein